MPSATTELTLYSTSAEVEALVRAFESCTLPRAEWTHAAHLTVALWYVLRHEWPDAVRLTRFGIKRYNEATGVLTTRERGYHETMTLFWLHAVRAFVEDDPEGRARDDLAVLANELLTSANKNLPFEFYSRERLMSWEARLAWVEPDLKPLPAARRASRSLTAQDAQRLACQHVEA